LDGDVIEIVRDGDTERAQKKTISQIARGQLDPLPTLGRYQKRQQHQQGKSGAGLRKNEGIDGTKSDAAQRQPPGKDGAAEGG